MRLVNWAEEFKTDKVLKEDIVKAVRRLELQFYVFIVGGVLLMMFGAVMMGSANRAASHAGLFAALTAVILMALMATRVNTEVAMYWVLRERQKATEDEIRRSEAADL